MRCLLLVLVVAGCGAEMVSAPGRSGLANAPVNEAARPGVVRYVAGGSGSLEQRNRQSAYDQMAGACGGAYRVDSEELLSEGAVTTAVPVGLPGSPIAPMAIAATTPMQYRYIRFSCLPAADQGRPGVATR